jgi:VCBS repeat-containing protein
VQALNAGQQVTETFTVTSADGTATENVVVTITGANDAATITGSTVGGATEDGAAIGGSLAVNDVDAGQAVFQASTNVAGTYGTFSINAAGAWTYTVNNASAAVQALTAGQVVADTFTVTSADGTASKNMVMTVTGVNDAASISGTAAAGAFEDGGSVGGTLSVSDVDTNQAKFQIRTGVAGSYGSFSINAAGNWTYTVNNASTAVQALKAGQQVTDSFTVTSADGTASQAVVATVTGVNDAALISGTSTANALEDGAAVGGTLNVADVDTGEAQFQPLSNVAGAYGSFSINSAGTWSYAVNNALAAVQALVAGQQVNETFTVTSADGTAIQNVVVTLVGTNDAAVISGTASANAQEDGASVVGTLSVSDADAGQSQFQAQTGVSASYGSFSIDTAGNWVYTVNNASASVQALKAGQQVIDTVAVFSADGTATQNVVVTITGTNDVATITGDSTAAGVEDGASVAGQLTVSDVDSGEAHFQTQTNALGLYGRFTINAAGSWLYAVDNSSPAVQALPAGQQVTDTFTVLSADGSASQTVVVTVTGTNDAALISGSSTASALEDGAAVGGTLLVTDVDTGENHFQPQSSAGAYGSFSINSAGEWSYNVDNSSAAVQALNAGQQVTETFAVQSADGSATQNVVLTVTGANDAASLGGNQSGSVSEDGVLIATGSLTVSDVDAGEAHVQPLSGVAGVFGTFSIDADGNWSYLLNNSEAAVQALNTGDQQQDVFTVLSQDGSTSATVTITLDGLDDNHAPVANADVVVTTSVSQPGDALTFSGIIEDYFSGPGDVLLSSVTEGDYYITNASTDILLMQNGPWIGYSNDLAEAIWSHTTNVFDTNQTPEISLVRNDGADFSLYSVRSVGYFYDFDGGNLDAPLIQHVVGYNDGVVVGQLDVAIGNGADSTLISFAGQAWAASVDHVDFFLEAVISTPLTNGYMESFIDDITFGTTAPVAELDIDALLNDTDADPGSVLSIAAFDAVSAHGGTVTLNVDGTFHYDGSTSDIVPGTTAYDSFTYQIMDELGALSNTATVGIVITGA